METWIITKEEMGSRIDRYLIQKLNQSRSQIQNQLENGTITVNQQSVKNGYVLKEGDKIVVSEGEVIPSTAVAEEMALDIVYEDNDLLVVNKESGLVVHPANGNWTGTLVNGLLYHSKNLSQVGGEYRPGIVHRIDADTSGLLVVAKKEDIHMQLAEQLKEKTVTRKYLALVWGVILNDTGTIDAPIGRDTKNRKKMAVTEKNSKTAVTHFTVLERYETATLLELRLETGRTHQIRVHMNYIGHPVVNDPVYGNKTLLDDTGQCLHAQVLGFIHPRTKEYLEFTSELPPCFTKILSQFKNE